MKLNFGLDTKNSEAYASLPVGAVKAHAWLERQLVMMKEGITGEMEKFPDYSNSEWLGASQGENWERGPYYLRGLVALAYVLDDEELKAKAQKWIDAVLSSSREGGMFGPISNDEWWSRMPVLMALRDYLEAKELKGESDPRIIPFITEYFRYQEKHLPQRPLRDWARARGGDNMDSVYWLYSRLYDEKDPDAVRWLLDLAELIHSQTQDWSRIMNETTVREHVVNTSQALKTPPLYYQQTGDPYDRDAFENGLFNIAIDHGRTDGLPNSDEAARDNKSTRGSELCGIVEGMLSTEIALRILRQAWMGDRLEKLAYNALPSAYSYDYTGHVYYILQNQVMATHGYHEFDCDHGDSSAFGAPDGFDCCFANNHMGWPKFVQSMWMARADGGIVAAAYGPCSVSYNGISFTESTNYPFDEKITLTYTGEQKSFTLDLRIPEWCEAPRLTVNSEEHEAPKGTFCKLSREWKKGDTVELVLPMSIRTEDGYNGSVALSAGPLIYSLPVKESWREVSDNSARELKVAALGKTQNREARADGDWSYALFTDRLELSFDGKVSPHPFTPAAAPTRIKAKGVLMPEWALDGNIAAVQPYGGARADKSRARELTLIPYGSTRLKITHFPRAEGRVTVYTDPMIKTRQGETFAEFANITLPEAESYDLVIHGKGSGRVLLNGRYSTPITFNDGRAIIGAVEKLIDKREMAFDRAHYNNVRVYGAEATAVEVVAREEFESLGVKEITYTANSISLRLNADRSFCSVTLLCGKQSGRYDREVSGFKSDKGTVSSLEGGTTYYVRATALINGRQVATPELAITTLDADERSKEPAGLDIKAERSHNAIILGFVRFPKNVRYEIDYGTEKGVYTKTVTDVIFNPYKGSGCFESDVTAFTVDGKADKYFVRMRAYDGNECVAQSDELELTV